MKKFLTDAFNNKAVQKGFMIGAVAIGTVGTFATAFSVASGNLAALPLFAPSIGLIATGCWGLSRLAFPKPL